MSEAQKYQEARDNPDEREKFWTNSDKSPERNEKSKENGDLGKCWEVIKNAKEISPEKGWDLRLMQVEISDQITTINENLQSWKITPKEKEEEMSKVIGDFIDKVRTTIWTNEASQAKQNKDFWEKTTTDITNYKKDLIKFLEWLVKINQDNSTKKRVEEIKWNENKELPDKLAFNWYPKKMPEWLENPSEWANLG